jgi:shikimate dehydrogenase
MTLRAFVVGHPIAHSRSPLLHGFWLEQHGIDGTFERIDVTPEDFPAFLGSLEEQGFSGGCITIPHKETAYRLVARRTERAERLQAVNTVWLEDGVLHGDNTDVIGFIENLDVVLGADWPALHRRALVLGAGGATRAVVAGLLDRGVERITIANRSIDKARELVAFDPQRIGVIALDEVPGALSQTDLLVNTTALGMTGKPPLEIDLSALPAHAAVSDIVYAPLETDILRQARERGLKAVDGLGMLLYQGVPGFEHWYGVRPKVTPALRALIEADLEGRS